jgi:hypothetical protein
MRPEKKEFEYARKVANVFPDREITNLFRKIIEEDQAS